MILIVPENLRIGANDLLRAVLYPFGGKGGGSGTFAQGFVPDEEVEGATAAVALAVREIILSMK